MENINQVQLTNQSSFVKQKFNLKNSEEHEVFLIPSFTLVTTPITSAENISCYEIFFQINYLYSSDPLKDKFTKGFINNLIFQYDLNYSSIPEARGQIFIAKLINFILISNQKLTEEISSEDNITPANKHLVAPIKLKEFVFKILLPVKAINKDNINTLHYSFNGQKSSDTRRSNEGHINNKNNSGSLNFYINYNPKYQISSFPKILSKEINILTIKNPLIFQTFIPLLFHSYGDFTIGAQSNETFYGLLIGQSLVDEIFDISFNNFNTLDVVPLKINHYLKFNSLNSNFNIKQYQKFLNNFIIHQSEFNLQQNLTLNIFDNYNNISDKKILASLIVNNDNKNSNEKYINFQEYILKLNTPRYLPITNEITNNFIFPYDKKFDFVINTSFKFETFFKYDINFNIIEHSDCAIMGDDNNIIKSVVSDKKNDEIIWVNSNKITLTYDQVRQYYITNDFTFSDYQTLKANRI